MEQHSATEQHAGGQRPRVVFVCTGNVCRSPVAELVFEDRWGPQSPWRPQSAGMAAEVGAPIDPQMASLLATDGIDAGRFAARQLDDSLVVPAALILTMTREQRSVVATRFPAAARRTFTLVEFARLAVHCPNLNGSDATQRLGDLRDWAMVHRGPLAVLAPERHPDIDDPLGQSPAAYRTAYERICDALDAILRSVALVP